MRYLEERYGSGVDRVAVKQLLAEGITRALPEPTGYYHDSTTDEDSSNSDTSDDSDTSSVSSLDLEPEDEAPLYQLAMTILEKVEDSEGALSEVEALEAVLYRYWDRIYYEV